MPEAPASREAAIRDGGGKEEEERGGDERAYHL